MVTTDMAPTSSLFGVVRRRTRRPTGPIIAPAQPWARRAMINSGRLFAKPQAAELLDRVYAGRYSDLKAGMTRYGLMLDESGVIISSITMISPSRSPNSNFVSASTSPFSCALAAPSV